MATSGSVSTNAYDGRYYQVSWTATQSVANNQSTISWTLEALGGSVSWYTDRTLNVVIGGSTVFSKTAQHDRYKGVIATGTKIITHDSNGDASFSISIEVACYWSSVNLRGSQTFTLTNIPRKSDLSVANGTLGTEQTLTVTRKSSSFKHTIVATCGSASTTICTKSSSTSISFTPPLSWASQNTTGTSVSVKYTITTYNGNTEVGNNSYTKTCSIPSSVKPSVSISVTDANGYESKFGAMVKGWSKFNIVLTPQTSYGSPIASYRIDADGSTYNTSSATTGVLKSSGTLTISANVTDKRGRSGSASTTKSVLDYSAPIITLLKVNRCDSDGTENNMGEYVKVTFSGNITSLNSKNSAAWTLHYKKSTDSNYTPVNMASETTYSFTNKTYIFAADTGLSYDVMLEVADYFTKTKMSTVASTAFTVIHFNAAGNAMAVGKVSEIEKLFDIGIDARFNGDVYGTIMGMGYLPPIPDNANLNEYLTPGAYRVVNNNSANTISNMPVKFAGRLKIEMATGATSASAMTGNWSYILQTYYDLNGIKYTRSAYTTGTAGVFTFEPWYTHDAIVAQGTSGIWTYRKWASGIAECWGTQSVSATGNGTSMSALNIKIGLSFPFKFAEDPIVNCNSAAQGTYNHVVGNCVYNVSGITDITLHATGSTTSTFSGKLQFSVKGRWK